MKIRVLLCLCAVFAASVSLFGAPRTSSVRPGIGDAVSYPQHGIRFRVFRGCHPSPMPTCMEFYSDKDTERKVKIVDLQEIWTIRQTMAIFISDDGISIKVLMPSLPVPKGVAQYRYKKGKNT